MPDAVVDPEPITLPEPPPAAELPEAELPLLARAELVLMSQHCPLLVAPLELDPVCAAANGVVASSSTVARYATFIWFPSLTSGEIARGGKPQTCEHGS